MGFGDQEQNSTPKLALFSFPINRAAEPLGMATPPVNTAGSVPFEWEEVPGKPRPFNVDSRRSAVVRCLELPPRLLLPSEAAKIANTPSPTTVLDGPYLGRSLSMVAYSKSFRKGKPSFREKVLLGSNRWGSFRKHREAVESKFDFYPSTADHGGGGVDPGGGPKVKITRIKRKGSLLGLSSKKSHLWASIYEGFKQVIPWRRRQENMRRINSATA